MGDAHYFLDLQTKTGWGVTLSRFSDWIAPQPSWLTLDVGCGPGMLPALLAKKRCQAFGIDLDPEMFALESLHHDVAVADTISLPYPARQFSLVTASNSLFLLPNPRRALAEMGRVLCPQGQIALLNPSENLNIQAAMRFSSSRDLDGLARDSLLNWAALAEANYRWSEIELDALFQSVGLRLVETITTVGPGFARFARAIWE